ncbi:MAG: C40 family peptidase [Thermoleophilia bacterium]
MAGRLPSPRWAAAWTALALTATVATSAVAAPTRDAAQARVETTQARIDAASAQLAALRAQLDQAQSPEAHDALAVRVEQAQERKDDLLSQLGVDQRTLDATPAPAAAATDPVTDAGGAPPVVRLVSVTAAAAPVAAATDTVAPAPSAPDAGTAGRIDAYLLSHGSPLAGLGGTFVSEAARVGLDPRLLVAISGAETSFGTYGPSQAIFNPFGLGPGMRFASWADAISRAAQNLGGPLYLGDRRVTIPAIQQRWAPEGATNDPMGLNSNWANNVRTNYAALGGDPNGSVFTGVTGLNPLTMPVLPTVGEHGAQVAQDAVKLLGTPNPADQPGGLDDAALVQVVYAKAGVDLPPSVAAQATRGASVAPTDLQAGDAVFFSQPDGTVTHVGLYLGAGQFVHAPGPGDTVRISSLYEAQWASAYADARR